MNSKKRIAAVLAPLVLAGTALLAGAGTASATDSSITGCTADAPEICVVVKYYISGSSIHVDTVQVQLKSTARNSVSYEVTGAWSSGGWTEEGLVEPLTATWEQAWPFSPDKNFSPGAQFCGHAAYSYSQVNEECVTV